MEKVKQFLNVLRGMKDFEKVKFVFLFGSYSRGKQNKKSDMDFAVYYDGNKKERFNFRLKLLSKLPDYFDVQIFQDLPLYVRIEVLKGRVIFSRDMIFVYDVAYQTIKNFDRCKKYYDDYISVIKSRI